MALPDVLNPSCCRCGSRPVRVVVGGAPLCAEHCKEWATEEFQAASELRILRVMSALDKILDGPIVDDWNDHLRKLAVAAVEAADS
jgi:hypothetical protein